jgi:hypothetical protein
MIGKLIPLLGVLDLCAALAVEPARAAPLTESDFTSAIIEMERAKPDRGDRVGTLLNCLKNWKSGDRAPATAVTITRVGTAGFTVSAVLRGRTLFHFQLLREQGDMVAVLDEIEYQRSGEMYDSLRDTESKRAVLRSVCAGK